jgi:hypothetical protein
MAAEYSRELGAKVIVGQNRLVTLGFRQGGSAGYGLRRLLVDRNRNPKALLKPGEYKSIQTDRVILIPGPDEEVKVIHEIYRLFIYERRSPKEIAWELNRRGLPNDKGLPWEDYGISRILTNPKYAGINVRNLGSVRLKQRRIRNPPELWVRCDHAFTPIVSLAEFEKACALHESQRQLKTDEDYLGRLRRLLERRGELNTRIINAARGVPEAGTYRHRFGTLRRAYALIGYTRPEDYRYMDARVALRDWWMEQRTSFIAELREHGAKIESAGSSTILINNEFTATFLMLLCRKNKGGNLRWNIELRRREIPDITVAVRLTPDNGKILDFYILPKAEIASRPELTLGIPGPLEAYRFNNLDFLTGAARRTPVEEVLCTQ